MDHSDSDSNNSSTWILLDDKGKADDNEEEKEERKIVQDVHEFEDSDGISIISDPEDSRIEDESTTYTVETRKQEEEEIELIKGKALVSLEPKPLKTSGSVTSALFMIAGLLIALYFQTGCEDETTFATKSQYTAGKTNNLVYKASKIKQRNNPSFGRGIHNKNGEAEVIFKKTYKDYDKKTIYEDKVKHEKGIRDKYFKKHKNYVSSGEMKYKEKYHGSHENDHKNNYYSSRYNDYKYNKDREEFLIRKQHYLRQKEDKLKQKELKMQSKSCPELKKEDKLGFSRDNYDHSMSGEWYGKMHQSRDEIRSNERRSEWVFERAQMRDKKRDKAHWYFNWMDDREDVRTRG